MEPLFAKDNGYFGEFGGAFVPEILKSTLDNLAEAFTGARSDPEFWQGYLRELEEYCGRPTPVTPLHNLSSELGGVRIYVKREDLNHTGAHKANNVMGQGLLARKMGKTRVIAETGAGQHGVATATMAARLGLRCTVYMGAVDVDRQRPNVFWMQQLGAIVVPVESGQATLKDAISEALRDWSDSMEDTHYVLGTACGPHPFPAMVAWFQSVVGEEARAQFSRFESHPPHRIYACVGGGSNALGIFQGFLDQPGTQLVGVEAGGLGPGHNAARLAPGNLAATGVAHGYKTRFLQDEEGQMSSTHSVAAGLDYMGVSPILAHLHATGRVRMEAAGDQEVVEAARRVMRSEGLIPALESAHAFAAAMREIPRMAAEETVLVCQSGRGDKDIFTVAEAVGDPEWKSYLKRRGEEAGNAPDTSHGA